MIVRTYGRRSRGLTRSYSDVVSDSPSQECPQDVYNFTFSSQDSAHCHWSDPYSFDSSQEPRELTILPSRKTAGCRDNGGGLWKRKKVKVSGVDSEPYALSSSQESKESKDYEVVVISDGDLEEPTPVKKMDYDPFAYDSSQELEEISVLPRRRGVENSVSGFSENGGSWKPKLKDVDSDICGLNSSGLRGLEISEGRECRGSRDSWDFDGVSQKSKKNCKEENGVLVRKKNKKKKSKKKKMEMEEVGLGDLVVTSTLMETQEFGEMMEHVDEVNFALDGLKKGQQVKIRRGSLLSLLSICGTAQHRRLLRVHGLTKTIINAVLGLNFDDPPSNLAAAALVYLLTTDGHDDRLLESPSCIWFLIKLLKPHASGGAKEKAPTIGSKLLGVCRNAGFLQDSAKGTDSSVTAIMLKVQDILVNCKELKPRDDDRTKDPKLNFKWISLLTMEKASLSTISIEDTSGTVRKMGGNFKEKFREYGGLDAVFEVARNCHSTMEEWLEKSPTFAVDLKDNLGLDSLLVLLKCLKIMENSTFLSKDNQCYLLGMKGKFDGQRAPRSFTELILSVIRILSGVTLLQRSSSSFQDEKMDGNSEEDNHWGGCCNMAVSQKSSSASPCNQCLIPWRPGSRSSQESSQASADPLLLKMRVESSSAVSCSGTYGNPNSVLHTGGNGSELDVSFTKKLLTHTNPRVEDSQDPFAFDDDDFEPSKWELLSGTGGMQRSLAQVDWGITRENEEFHHSALMFSQQESSNMDILHSEDASCSSAGDEEMSSLLADCLLTAVKVLMNLANDNLEGCRQIAKVGGLEILSSLIAGHFPSFSLSMSHSDNVRESSLSSKSSPRVDQQSNAQLTDQELDFLVAILGLLVNLVEKDGCNRSRLASVTVSLPSVSGLDMEDERNVISLLCSIFLANHGAGEAAGEDKCFSLEDEESMLQGAKEAEKMIVEAYSALLLAFLSTESNSTRRAIAKCLPNQKLAVVCPVLERFVEFHMTMNMISPETHTAVLEVIESCRIP